MISNPERTALVSSMGWVDRDSLWRFDTRTSAADSIPLRTGARHLSLHTSGSGRFTVVHHFDGACLELTVHAFADPEPVLARASITSSESRLTGDAAIWRDVPPVYAAYLAFEPWKDFVLLKVSPGREQIDVQRLEWYDETYDKGYQGVVDVVALPGGHAAVVSVQRSSTLIVHDLETGRKTNSLNLGRGSGNPLLQLRNEGAEIWASNYDTLVVIDRASWRILRSARLQRAALGTGQFIGDYSFAPDADSCLVARPFSADVVSVDVATLKITQSAKLGRQPLELVALQDGEVIARDWKTGDLLRGSLHRRSFGWF